MSEGTARCVICTGEKAAALGLLICAGHRTKVADLINQIEDEVLHLDARPSMAQRVGVGSGSLVSERVGARLEVIATLDPRTRQWTPDEVPAYVPMQAKRYGPWCLFCEHESCMAWRAGRRRDLHDDEHDAGSANLLSALGVLHGWERVVIEERDLSASGPATVTGACATLLRHLDWIAAQPFVDDLHNELRQLLGVLRELNKTTPPRPMTRCVVRYPEGLCGGQVWEQEVLRAVQHVTGGRMVVGVPDGPAVCDTCGASWVTDADKARLNLMIRQEHDEKVRPRTEDGRLMRTAEEIMRDENLTRSAFDVKAHRLRKAGQGGVSHGGYYDPAGFEKVSA